MWNILVGRQKIKFAKIAFQKVSHKNVDAKAILISYLDSAWKNTWETQINFNVKKNYVYQHNKRYS